MLADHSEWVPWVEQNYFFHDGTPRCDVLRVAASVLREWAILGSGVVH